MRPNFPSRSRRTGSPIASQLAILAAFLGLWHVASVSGLAGSNLPSPLLVTVALVRLAVSGELFFDLAASVHRILVGFGLAVLVGGMLGILAARYTAAYSRFSIVLNLLSSIPPIAWTPLAILWFGIGNGPAFFIVFLGAFFPLFASVYSAIQNTENTYLDAAKVLGANRLSIVTNVVVPSAIPIVFVGLRTALTVAWFNVIAAELIGVTSGLGYKLQLNRTLLFSDNVIAFMLAIGTIGWIMGAGIRMAAYLIAPWSLQESEQRTLWINRRRAWLATTQRLCGVLGSILPVQMGSKKNGREERIAIGTSLVKGDDEAAFTTDCDRSDNILARIRDLGHSFPLAGGGDTQLEVLRNVSFDLKVGEVLAITGPNGCGKSVLLRILSGLLNHTRGRVTVVPDSLTTTLVFQKLALFPWKTVIGNVEYALRFRNVSRPSHAQLRQDAMELLKSGGLHQFADTFPTELSGGMQQRLALIRALAVNPKLLLLDEPFASFDPLARAEIQNGIQSLLPLESTTVVLVTHDIDEAIFLADRILVLSKRPGTIQQILDVPFPHPRNPVCRTSGDFLTLRARLWELLASASATDSTPNSFP